MCDTALCEVRARVEGVRACWLETRSLVEAMRGDISAHFDATCATVCIRAGAPARRLFLRDFVGIDTICSRKFLCGLTDVVLLTAVVNAFRVGRCRHR